MTNIDFFNGSPFMIRRKARPLTASLDLWFTSALDPMVTFARAGTGTYVNSAGILTTATANTPRLDHDPVTLQPKGLLIEGARTNMFLQSNDFTNAVWTKARINLTANYATAPDGTTTATRVQEQATTSTKVFQQSATYVAGFTTASIYVKADGRNFFYIGVSNNGTFGAHFDLSNGTLGTILGVGTVGRIQALSNGWYRISMTWPSTAGSGNIFYRIANATNSTSYTGDGVSGVLVWGAQVENGEFASSYIATTTAALTRVADSAVISGANFSNFYNASEGTWVADFSALANTASAHRRILEIGDTTANERMAIGFSTASTAKATVIDNGASQVDFTTTITNLTNANRIAFGYKANAFAMSVNGNAAVEDTAGTVPTVNMLAIGNESTAVNADTCLFGHISRIRYFSSKVANIGDISK